MAVLFWILFVLNTHLEEEKEALIRMGLQSVKRTSLHLSLRLSGLFP